MKIPLLSKLKLVARSGRCCHRNADGSGCKANPLRGREYCFFHDPDPKVRARRKDANRTGGAHSRRRKRKRAFNPLETPGQMGAFLRELMNDVRDGEVGVRKANALARVTPLVLGIIDREIAQVEQAKYEAWIAAEDERIAARKKLAAESRGDISWTGATRRWAAMEQRAGTARDICTAKHAAPEFEAGAAGDTSTSTETTAARVGEPASCATRTVELHTSTMEDTSDTTRATAPDAVTTAAADHSDEDDVEVAILENTTDPEDDSAESDEDDSEERERIRKLQAELIARIESKYGQNPGAGDGLRKASEGSDSEEPTGRNERESVGQPETADDEDTKAEERRRRKIEEWRELQEHQLKVYGCCSPDLDFNLPSGKRHESKGEHLPLDVARTRLDTQNAALKKEIAYGIAPTTMKHSVITDEGVVAAPHGRPPARAPGRNRDNEPSPIPGLLNRHLNYLKYDGMPVSALKRMGFVWHRRW